jgi:hypothetical protein
MIQNAFLNSLREHLKTSCQIGSLLRRFSRNPFMFIALLAARIGAGKDKRLGFARSVGIFKQRVGHRNRLSDRCRIVLYAAQQVRLNDRV